MATLWWLILRTNKTNCGAICGRLLYLTVGHDGTGEVIRFVTVKQIAASPRSAVNFDRSIFTFHAVIALSNRWISAFFWPSWPPSWGWSLWYRCPATIHPTPYSFEWVLLKLFMVAPLLWHDSRTVIVNRICHTQMWPFFFMKPTEFASYKCVFDVGIDIFVNFSWVATRWQQYSTHLHTNNT
jgi:hypothetical protein